MGESIYFFKDSKQDVVVSFNKDTLEFFLVKPIVEEIYNYTKANGIGNMQNKYKLPKEEVENLLEMQGHVAEDKKNSKSEMSENRIKKLERMVLSVANSCNMKCKYCYASGGSYHSEESIMLEEDCFKSIDAFIDFFDEIGVIQFFGGEPLMNTEIIAKACAYFVQKCEVEGKMPLPRFGLCTNGTLINDSVIDLIKKYNIGITISIDGDKLVHDENRIYNNGIGTYNQIIKNANKLYEQTGQPGTFEVTYNQVHVTNNLKIKDIVAHLGAQFPKTTFHIVPVSTENNQLELKDREAFLESVDDVFNSFESGNPFNYSLVQRLIEGLREKRRTDYICNAGLGTLSVDTRGNLYPCFMFTDIDKYNMGSIYDEKVFESETMLKIRKEILSYNKNQDVTCQECFLENLCSGCFGMNYFNKGEISNYNKEFCEMNKKMAEKVIVRLARIYQKAQTEAIVS